MNPKEEFRFMVIMAIIISVIVGMFFATTACAQDIDYVNSPPTFRLAEPMSPNPETIPPGATLTPVHVGDRARVDGVLYSLEANAWLLSEMQRVQNYWILEMNTRVNITLAWADHELLSQANRHNADNEIMQVRLNASERNVESLMETNRELLSQVGWTRREKFRFVVSIIGVGAIAGLGGYFIGSAVGN